jgi:hypothetical protein
MRNSFAPKPPATLAAAMPPRSSAPPGVMVTTPPAVEPSAEKLVTRTVPLLMVVLPV